MGTTMIGSVTRRHDNLDVSMRGWLRSISQG
jgi:hypothetical protein